MTQTFKFDRFGKALDFLEQKRREGFEGITFPSKGGDTHRNFGCAYTTQPEEHIVLIITEDNDETR